MKKQKEVIGYMVVNKFNQPIVMSSQLPIYWRKYIAKKTQQLNFGSKIKKVKIVEL